MNSLTDRSFVLRVFAVASSSAARRPLYCVGGSLNAQWAVTPKTLKAALPGIKNSKLKNVPVILNYEFLRKKKITCWCTD